MAMVFRILGGLVVLGLIVGCASRPINQPIESVDPETGYRPAVMLPKRSGNDPSTLFILSFSGGGTRAAALSYGVLEELNETSYVHENGEKRRLIDEVDVITGVSGGSFTALSFALYGDRLFDEYEQRFLKRNVQGALARRAFLNPANWFRMMSGNYGRSEVAAEYYDEILFEGATFDDLMEKDTPVAIASGTDITSGSRFAFYQDDFDLLCSDLGAVRLSRAAATSSAVPMALSPVTLNNYGGSCNYQYPAWVSDALQLEAEQLPPGRELERYKEMAAFRDSKNRPYIHLVDGGVSDNIGVRGVLIALEGFFFSKEFSEAQGFGGIKRIILIIVNARSAHDRDWQQKESPPGSFKQLAQSTGVPIERYSFESIELMKDQVEAAGLHRKLRVAEAINAGASREEAEARFPKTVFHVMDVSFDDIRDSKERDYFMDLPTSFVLEDEEVDRLRGVAGDLMRQTRAYQEFLQSIGAQSPE